MVPQTMGNSDQLLMPRSGNNKYGRRKRDATEYELKTKY
jgi:hypothetical protein